jgi:hypothetical protein
MKKRELEMKSEKSIEKIGKLKMKLKKSVINGGENRKKVPEMLKYS